MLKFLTFDWWSCMSLGFPCTLQTARWNNMALFAIITTFSPARSRDGLMRKLKASISCQACDALKELLGFYCGASFETVGSCSGWDFFFYLLFMWRCRQMSFKYCEMGAQSDVTYPRFTGGNISPGGCRAFSRGHVINSAGSALLTSALAPLATFYILRPWL